MFGSAVTTLNHSSGIREPLVSIRGDEEGPILKPPPKIKGGKKPKDSGRRFERQIASKYGGTRVVGSGAFGEVDPVLKGDVRIPIGSLKLLSEAKKRAPKINMKGEKSITLSVDMLDKIQKEAAVTGEVDILIFGVKGRSTEWAIIEWPKLYDMLRDYEHQISALDALIEEAYEVGMNGGR